MQNSHFIGMFDFSLMISQTLLGFLFTQSAGAVEYTDCTSAEG